MITLLTATNNRAKQFSYVQDCIKKQTYKGPLQWIVASTTGFEGYSFECNQLLLTGWSKPGRCDMNANLLAACLMAHGDSIFIIEDDDYYSPGYLDYMLARLEEVPLLGLLPYHCYHLPSNTWELVNSNYSPLASTAFRLEVMPTFQQCLGTGKKEVDQMLWVHWSKTLKRRSGFDTNLWHHIGLKHGEGLGAFQHELSYHDPDRTLLSRWVGGNIP